MPANKLSKSSHSGEIVVAIIGLIGVMATAVLSNLDKIEKWLSSPRNAVEESVLKPSIDAKAVESGSSPEIVIDFARIRTDVAPGKAVAAQSYLFDYGISVTRIDPPGSDVVIINNLALYRGEALKSPETQNILTQVNTGNDPASFTLEFKEPVARVSFVRPKMYSYTDSGVTHPAWIATAFDKAGHALSSHSEALNRSHSEIPEAIYALRATALEGIASVRFDSDLRLDGKPFAAFGAILIERLNVTRKVGDKKQVPRAGS